MDRSRLLTSLFVARCFELVDGEESLCDVLAANSLPALSALLQRVQGMHGRFHHVRFSRDMPHYYGIAHLKLAQEI